MSFLPVPKFLFRTTFGVKIRMYYFIFIDVYLLSSIVVYKMEKCLVYNKKSLVQTNRFYYIMDNLKTFIGCSRTIDNLYSNIQLLLLM